MAGKSIETMTAHERAHIDFPRAITSTEARDLLRGLGDHLSMTINATYEGNLSFTGNPETDYEEERKFSGRISPRGESSFHPTAFDLLSEGGQEVLGKYTAIRFFVTPGYDLPEINNGEIALWDSARDFVPRYINESDRISEENSPKII